MLNAIQQFFTRFWFHPSHPIRIVREDKWMHEGQSERELDKTLQDSFPSSDPPAWH